MLIFMDLGPMQLAVISLRILQIELHRQTPLRPPCHWSELRSTAKFLVQNSLSHDIVLLTASYVLYSIIRYGCISCDSNYNNAEV